MQAAQHAAQASHHAAQAALLATQTTPVAISAAQTAVITSVVMAHDSAIDDLKAQMHKLETKVENLEKRFCDATAKSTGRRCQHMAVSGSNFCGHHAHAH